MIGVSIAGEAAVFADAPIGYSSFYTDELKPSYEYSTSVQTPSYNNFAHVRSGGEIERKYYNTFPQYAAAYAAPVIAAQPIVAETRFLQPEAPVLKTNIAVARADVPILQPAAPVLKSNIAIARADVPFLQTATPVAAPSTRLVPLAFEQRPFPSFYRLAYQPKLVAGNSFNLQFCFPLSLFLLK